MSADFSDIPQGHIKFTDLTQAQCDAETERLVKIAEKLPPGEFADFQQFMREFTERSNVYRKSGRSFRAFALCVAIEWMQVKGTIAQSLEEQAKNNQSN